MKIIPANLSVHLAECVAMRRETHLLSYGAAETFAADTATDYFWRIAQDPHGHLLHVWEAGVIIGQLEFRCPLMSESEPAFGYVHLIYLAEEYRRAGRGKKLMDFMLTVLLSTGCQRAYLRYLPKNVAAAKFYAANGWQVAGECQPNGQLLVKHFSATDVAQVNRES